MALILRTDITLNQVKLPRTKFGYIYWYYDSLCLYVGQTHQHPYERLWQHIQNSENYMELVKWGRFLNLDEYLEFENYNDAIDWASYYENVIIGVLLPMYTRKQFKYENIKGTSNIEILQPEATAIELYSKDVFSGKNKAVRTFDFIYDGNNSVIKERRK